MCTCTGHWRKKASTTQHGYRKPGTHARVPCTKCETRAEVLSLSLPHENSKNEIRIKRQNNESKGENMNRGQAVPK